MAKDETRRLRPADLQADKDTSDAIAGMADYSPSNPSFTQAKIVAARKTMDDAQKKEIQDDGVARASRDAATAAEWEFHNMALGAKTQVVAQYGDDSDEVQSIGLTRKSERAKPTRKPQDPTPPK